MLNAAGDDACYDCLHNDFLIERRGTETIRNHNHFRLDASQYDMIAYFVRNPYDRLRSCYQYFLAGGLNQYKKGHFPADERIQEQIRQQFPTFESCCFSLGDFCTLVPHARPIFSALPELSHSDKVFVGRYESFPDDVSRLFDLLGIGSLCPDIAHANKGSRQVDIRFSTRMRDHVYEYYMKDFLEFGYDARDVS
jgi:hypothetical protein